MKSTLTQCAACATAAVVVLVCGVESATASASTSSTSTVMRRGGAVGGGASSAFLRPLVHTTGRRRSSAGSSGSSRSSSGGGRGRTGGQQEEDAVEGCSSIMGGRRGVRRAAATTMLVDVDVKVRGDTATSTAAAAVTQGKFKTVREISSTKSGSNAPAAADAESENSLAPVPRDDFRHKSLADVPTDYGPYMKVGSYKINFFGFFFFFVAMFWAVPWALSLALAKALLPYTDKIEPGRRHIDWTSMAWGWCSALFTDSLPEVTGLENMPEGPAVFVANHASWMDVPYSAQLPVRAKYLAKNDLCKVPVLGNAMSMAQHVLLDREDKRSQIEALRSALNILKTGTPVFVFPEGTRGPAGRMQSFKMGAFKIATKAGVPIVPVSIAGTHIMMPKEVIMPQCAGRGITAIHVHPPIPSKGRTEKELADLSFDIINEALSDEQRCLPSTPKDDATSAM